MSLKRLLGLDKFPIEEAEILRRIEEANLANQSVVEFSFGKQSVKVHLKQISHEGIMKGYEDYYVAH